MSDTTARVTLQEAAQIIDQVADAPLGTRERYVSARHLQDRLAGRPVNRRQYEETFEAWTIVKAAWPRTAPLL